MKKSVRNSVKQAKIKHKDIYTLMTICFSAHKNSLKRVGVALEENKQEVADFLEYLANKSERFK